LTTGPRADAESFTESEKRAAASDRNDHSLRALAIKKNQIHVVGAPSLRLGAVPVFLDVEGVPDKDFYYLVGLRFQSNGKHVERSFWADDLEGERAYGTTAFGRLRQSEAPRSSPTAHTRFDSSGR
jgi:hypothetical protein